MAAPKAPKLDGTTPCKACGAPLVFAKSATGATIPLDTRTGPHTYQLVIHEGVVSAKPVGAYVSHFLTCPQASTFSTRTKEE